MRLLSMVKIPLVAFVGPIVERLNDEECSLRIPFRWRVKNHLGSMFFGALMTAADTTYGLLYFHLIAKNKKQVPGIIKEGRVEFFKRVEADAVFTCKDGAKIQALMDQSLASGERVEDWVEVIATVPKKFGTEPVAKFQMLVSMKARK